MNTEKEEIKIALVMDDYKLKNKEDWWQKCLAQRPDIEQGYDFVREELHPGVSKDTTTAIRFYKKKS